VQHRPSTPATPAPYVYPEGMCPAETTETPTQIPAGCLRASTHSRSGLPVVADVARDGWVVYTIAGHVEEGGFWTGTRLEGSVPSFGDDGKDCDRVQDALEAALLQQDRAPVARTVIVGAFVLGVGLDEPAARQAADGHVFEGDRAAALVVPATLAAVRAWEYVGTPHDPAWNSEEDTYPAGNGLLAMRPDGVVDAVRIGEESECEIGPEGCAPEEVCDFPATEQQGVYNLCIVHAARLGEQPPTEDTTASLDASETGTPGLEAAREPLERAKVLLAVLDVGQSGDEEAASLAFDAYRRSVAAAQTGPFRVIRLSVWSENTSAPGREYPTLEAAHDACDPSEDPDVIVLTDGSLACHAGLDLGCGCPGCDASEIVVVTRSEDGSETVGDGWALSWMPEGSKVWRSGIGDACAAARSLAAGDARQVLESAQRDGAPADAEVEVVAEPGEGADVMVFTADVAGAPEHIVRVIPPAREQE
jgi:hypothetical protein